MKRILIALIAGITILAVAGCAVNNANMTKFNEASSEFYVQMFTDGEQTEEVNAMYDEYIASYGNFEDSELYEAISGMYQGLNNGNATKYQLDAMLLFDDIN